MACYTNFEIPINQPRLCPTVNQQPAEQRQQKDYSRPLHVDCSVEYELPNQAQPPGRSEPLLMIHPCYYRRAESQRQNKFINNLPGRGLVPGLVPQQRRSNRTAVGVQQYPAVPQLRLADPPQQHIPRPDVNMYQQPVQQHQQPNKVVVQQAAAPVGWNMDMGVFKNMPPVPAAVPITKKTEKQKDSLISGGDFSSGSDSGVSGHWTDSERSPLVPELRLQRDFQGGPDSGVATPVSLVEDKTLLADLFAATCDTTATTAVNMQTDSHHTQLCQQPGARCLCVPSNQLQKSTQQQQQQQQLQKSQQLPKPPQQRQQQQQQPLIQQHYNHLQQQQPAVAVAAVAPACKSCKGCEQEILQSQSQQRLMQPWTGMTAPSQFHHPSVLNRHRASVMRSAEPGPEHAASSLHVQMRRTVPWARTTSVKRSRVASVAQQQQPNSLQENICPPGNNNNTQPWLANTGALLQNSTDVNAWPKLAQTAPTYNKDCRGGCVCKLCCGNGNLQQQQQHNYQPPQQMTNISQQWGATYYGQCRGASEDGSNKVLWNNENMLRLFQV